MGIARFEDIEAWKEARELTQRIYQVSESGRLARDFGLRDQMRRAAVSVMATIAGGFDSQSDGRFLSGGSGGRPVAGLDQIDRRGNGHQRRRLQ